MTAKREKFACGKAADSKSICRATSIWAATTLRVNVPDPEMPDGQAIVTIVEMTNKPQGLQMNCEQCEIRCDHMAAVLGMVLDEKLTLGLSAPPDPNEPIENLTEDELVRRALADRQQRAETEKMTLRSTDSDRPWTDYTVTSRRIGQDLPRFLARVRTGRILLFLSRLSDESSGNLQAYPARQRQGAQTLLRTRCSNNRIAAAICRCDLDYGRQLGLRFNLPHQLDDEAAKILGKLRDADDRRCRPAWSSACGSWKPPATRFTSTPTPRNSSSSDCCRSD